MERSQIQIIYAAKHQILRNEARIRLAIKMRDFSAVGSLQQQNEQLRQSVLLKHAVII